MFSIMQATIHRNRLHDLKSIREREELVSQLEEQTITDSLTGIGNRRGFARILDYEFRQLKRKGGYAIALGDIDHFKNVNDTWGHDCGDLVIKNAARIIGESIRAQDSLARWGGEEFVILLKNGTVNENQIVVERVRVALESRAVNFRGEEIHFTMSFGLAMSHPDDADGEDAVIRADRMLYRAKNTGRNRLVLFDDSELESDCDD